MKKKSEQKLEELRARSRKRYRNMTPQQRQKKNEYGKRYRQKKKLKKFSQYKRNLPLIRQKKLNLIKNF